MKSTGIVRRMDNLGRVVIPKETRRMLGIKEGDAIEIFVEDDVICLKKFNTNLIAKLQGIVEDFDSTTASQSDLNAITLINGVIDAITDKI